MFHGTWDVTYFFPISLILFFNKNWQHTLFLCVLLCFLWTCFLLSSLSVNTEDGCSRQLKHSLKMIKILSLWYSQVVLTFLKDNDKKLFRNLEHITLKLERNESYQMGIFKIFYCVMFTIENINIDKMLSGH